MLAGKETEGFSPRADATLTNRSVRRGSPNSAAPKVSTAHASAFCNVSVFIPLSPLLFCAPLFFNVRLPYKCQIIIRLLRVNLRVVLSPKPVSLWLSSVPNGSGGRETSKKREDFVSIFRITKTGGLPLDC